MSDHTGIEWTDATWNPVTGCSKVSQGCKNCYALRDWQRLSANPKTVYFGRAFTDVAAHPERLDQPMRWKRPRRIFVNSMSDLFHESVPDDFIDRVFAVMALAPQHSFQVLTKRPERMRDYMTQDDGFGRWGYIDGWARRFYEGQHNRPFPVGKILLGPLPHVWLGVSVEDQATADDRIPILLRTPAAVRWLSAEPLLGPIDIEGAIYRSFGVPTPDCPWPHLHWVVAGGESGPKARPSHPKWFHSLRDQCKGAGVPFLFKQLGEWIPGEIEDPADGNLLFHDDFGTGIGELSGRHQTQHLGGVEFVRVGKKTAGRRLDGVTHDGYPK